MRDVYVLLDDADEKMRRVHEMYKESIRAEQLGGPLQALIKNVLENWRSCLDYIADAVTQRDGKRGTKSYFPCSPNEIDFEKCFDQKMPGVRQKRSDLAITFLRHQPFQPGHAWVEDLVTLTNENKHRQLTPQTREEIVEFMSGPGGGFIEQVGGARITMGESALIRMGKGAKITFGGRGPVVAQNMKKTVLVDWLFADPRKSAIATLDAIQRGIRPTVEDLLGAANL